MSEKKVIAFIVEGPSDEAALGSVMKEYFSSSEVQFVVVHGDITLKDYVTADNVIKRNRKKREILDKLRKTGKVHGIPYRVYYNSCNLEHVLYNELRNFSDEEKQILSDAFADKYENRVDAFIEFISDPLIAVSGTFQETWKHIEKGRNSLRRHTNMRFIFE